MSNPQFTASVYQNQFLADGADEVHAIVAVSAKGSTNTAAGGLVVGLICDNSGSMDSPNIKIREARKGLIKAVEELPPHAKFFVIAGNSGPILLVPICTATPENKDKAIAKIKGITAHGGTCISTWLTMAREEFAKVPGAIHQAILLTDGENDSNDRQRLEKELGLSAGKFQCDCRGVGTGFRPDELRLIAGKLLGGVDMIRDEAGMASDFAALINKAGALAFNDVMLQLWSPTGSTIQFVKQMTPQILDLTSKRAAGPNPLTSRFPTGAWGEETREYHVCIKVAPGKVGATMLAGRFALVYTENGTEVKVGEAQIKATWTDDEQLSARIDPHVAAHTGQAELAQKIQEGLAAKQKGDIETATKALGRAVELAESTGNEGTKRLLEKVVDVEKDGTVRLKAGTDAKDVLELDTRSTRTKRVS